jgi:hypothetical protein
MPAASRRARREEEQTVVPGRVLSPEVSRVAGKAIRELVAKMEENHGRSLYPEEVSGVIQAVEKESRKRRATDKKPSRNGHNRNGTKR